MYDMGMEFKVILTAIIIEISLISTLIILFYAVKIISIIRNKQQQKFIKEIEGHLSYLITRDLPFNSANFKKNGLI